MPRLVPINKTSFPSAFVCGKTAKTFCDGKPCSESSSDTTGPTSRSSRMRTRPLPRVLHQISFVSLDCPASTNRASTFCSASVQASSLRHGKTPRDVQTQIDAGGVPAVEVAPAPFKISDPGPEVIRLPPNEEPQSLA